MSVHMYVFMQVNTKCVSVYETKLRLNCLTLVPQVKEQDRDSSRTLNYNNLKQKHLSFFLSGIQQKAEHTLKPSRPPSVSNYRKRVHCQKGRFARGLRRRPHCFRTRHKTMWPPHRFHYNYKDRGKVVCIASAVWKYVLLFSVCLPHSHTIATQLKRICSIYFFVIRNVVEQECLSKSPQW